MSKKRGQKHKTKESRTLQFLRQQAGLSTRGAAKASGIGDGIINHLEHGRVRVHPHHLEKLLPAYGATLKTYEMFASGKVALPQDLRKECIEIVQMMSLDQLQTAYPVLRSLSNNN
jgi:transcriptional regulator with XRE-family HTH domain